ncbi:hypothetical protein C2G38_854680 [Gigaspora rosea]|uniref:Response regulatory domain-containing protein n=1 Tax=Gigaspora rosea TaxID=44941 RepID=A0A397VLT1_9GLOM|nr:hypothetical protein C2G38_854680 [Gigaspora rosea]
MLILLILVKNGKSYLLKIIMICDIMMPNMDGYELLEALRSNEKNSINPYNIIIRKS